MLNVCFLNHYHLYSFYIVQNIIMLYGQHNCVKQLIIFNIIIQHYISINHFQHYISHLLQFYFILKLKYINLFTLKTKNGLYIKYIFKNFDKGFYITYMYNINQNKVLTCCS